MRSGTERCLKNEFVQPAILAPAVASDSLYDNTGKESEDAQDVLAGSKFGDVYQLEAGFRPFYDMGGWNIIFRRLAFGETTT